MKKVLILLAFLPALSFAQRNGGDFSISAMGGLAKEGINGQLHTDYYIPYTQLILQGRLMYYNQNLPTDYEADMNLQQFGFSALIGWSPEKQIKAPFFLNFLVGGYVGYDYGNKGKDLFSAYDIPYDVKEMNKMTYGFITSLQGEINLSPTISIIADFSQVYRFGSKFGKNTYSINGGLKFYLNN